LEAQVRRQFSAELEEDRTFEIGGEEFTFYYPHHSVVDRIYQEDLDAIADPEGNTNGSFSFKADTEKAIEYTKLFLEDAEQKKRWEALVKRKTQPVPRFQIVQLYRWLVEVTSGRPTRQPSDSLPGAGETGSSSTDGSSSTEETPTP
jgi:hypothetical protein